MLVRGKGPRMMGKMPVQSHQTPALDAEEDKAGEEQIQQ